MKIFLCVTLLAANVWATDSKTQATTSTTPAKAEVGAGAMHLKVSGMTCGGCEDSIKAAVEKVPGVKSCKADHKTGQVTVVGDGKTTVDQKAVTAAITKAGYQVAN